MDVNPVGSGAPSIVERAKAIILQPKSDWPVIEGETTPSGDIFMRYAVPLAAIGPVAQLLGSQMFGYIAFGVTYRPPLIGSLSAAILGFILSLVGIFIISFIANKLAPKFGGEGSSRAAFKLVVYSMTAGWLAGIFALIPSIGYTGAAWATTLSYTLSATIATVIFLRMTHIPASELWRIRADDVLSYFRLLRRLVRRRPLTPVLDSPR